MQTVYYIFFLFVQENKLWKCMQIVDNLHELSIPIVQGQIRKKYFNKETICIKCQSLFLI